jgi:hypothetical protein
MSDDLKAQFDHAIFSDVVKVKEYFSNNPKTSKNEVLLFLRSNGWLTANEQIIKRYPCLSNVQLWLVIYDFKRSGVIEVRIGIAEISARYPVGYTIAVLGEYKTTAKSIGKRKKKAWK